MENIAHARDGHISLNTAYFNFSDYYLLTILLPVLVPDLEQGLFIINEPLPQAWVLVRVVQWLYPQI